MKRKTIRIIIIVITFIFLLRNYVPVDLEQKSKTYFYIIFFTVLSLLSLYEVLQVLKDDKINGTNSGKKRIIILSLFAAIYLMVQFLQRS